MAMGRPVRLVLDASLLLEPSATGEAAAALRPGAEALLRRLRYSNLTVAICYVESMSTHESGFLEKVASSHSFGCMPLLAKSGNRSPNESMLEWSRTSSCFYVTSRADKGLISELQIHNWRVVSVGNEYNIEVPGVLNVGMLQELLLTLATLIKRRGAFPIYPSKDGLIFVPLSFDLPLSSQLQEVDMVLHKITDEVVKIDPNCSIDFPKGISFSAGMSEIIRFVEECPDFCIIDPFKNIYPLLDRLQIQNILVRLKELGTEGKPKLRAPYSLKVDNFHDGELDKHLTEANLSFPLIVKPQVACGVADAHNMALVFQIEELSNLAVPLPAVLQEYVDHGSKIFKFYVIGDKVFHTVRNSMPNASFLKSSSGAEPLTFNSLKTLPVATKEQQLQTRVQDSKSVDADLVEESAKFLKGLLGLTIFGFDVVVQEGTGDHVIVDLNYLPSFKEVPDSEAVPAFWDAIRQTYELKRAKAQT
ncbi:inositol-tetrakisphosphate 1-kinase 6 isoform X1 [Panicum miliaceum]|uniref:Inositol-tetrakisphosphate 1-kinase 6 n=1 Tax=Panicum miliaceum TaxID=4540 RepID=A0A3L6T6K3_PANMI|nr:inositol-tetrakisphosphate 1-kinase 6 isoform X1 [Panicum miliaceum]